MFLKLDRRCRHVCTNACNLLCSVRRMREKRIFDCPGFWRRPCGDTSTKLAMPSIAFALALPGNFSFAVLFFHTHAATKGLPTFAEMFLFLSGIHGVLMSRFHRAVLGSTVNAFGQGRNVVQFSFAFRGWRSRGKKMDTLKFVFVLENGELCHGIRITPFGSTVRVIVVETRERRARVSQFW